MSTKRPSPYQTVERIQRSLMQIQHRRTTEENQNKWSSDPCSGILEVPVAFYTKF